jgi:hypothetical protein
MSGKGSEKVTPEDLWHAEGEMAGGGRPCRPPYKAIQQILYMIDIVIPCTCPLRTAAAKGLEPYILSAYLPDLVNDTLAGDRDLCNRQHGSYIFLPYLSCSEAHYLTKGHHEFNAVVNRDTFVLRGQRTFCGTRVHPFLHLQHFV